MMPLVAYRKSTGQPIPDFQREATAAGLTANAMRRGIAESDLDIRALSNAEYDALERSVYASARATAEAEEVNLRAAADELRQRLGLSLADLPLLARLVMRGMQ